MTEKEEAVKLANAVLEKPYLDPDGDISVLARQFLRAREEIDAMREALRQALIVADKQQTGFGLFALALHQVQEALLAVGVQR